jgi:hypothetical protein
MATCLDNPNSSRFRVLPRQVHLVAYTMSLTNALLIVGALCIFRASSSVLERPEKSNDTNHVDMALSSDNITTLPVNPSLDLSWPLSSPSAQTANFSNSSLSTFSGVTPDPSGVPSLNTAVTKCDGSVYGFDLNAASCQEAWNLLPKSTNRRTFGKRSEGHFNVPLPFRILSCKYHMRIMYHQPPIFYLPKSQLMDFAPLISPTE